MGLLAGVLHGANRICNDGSGRCSVLCVVGTSMCGCFGWSGAVMYKIPVKRADVYAARARIQLDKQSGRETPEWVKKLAEVDISAWERWEKRWSKKR